MTYLRYGFLALFLAAAVTVALANRADVTLALWPDAVTGIVGTSFSVTLPIFIVVGLAFGIGLLFGLGFEWLRERGIRAEAARLRRQIEAASASVGESRSEGRARDDILALVDEPRRTGS